MRTHARSALTRALRTHTQAQTYELEEFRTRPKLEADKLVCARARVCVSAHGCMRVRTREPLCVRALKRVCVVASRLRARASGLE